MLSFASAKDFEAPDDADADGAYEVTVRVSDGANETRAELTGTHFGRGRGGGAPGGVDCGGHVGR